MYEPKNTKNNLTSSPQIADKVFFFIVEHLSLVVEWCFNVDSYFKLSRSYHVLWIMIINAKTDQ